MRIKVLALAASLLLISDASSGSPQTAATATNSPQAAAIVTKDAQAVSLISRALAVAGANNAAKDVRDFKASGTITYNSDQEVQGNVVFQGSGLGKFRMDVHLPTESKSLLATRGQIQTKTQEGTMRSRPDQSPLVPARLIVPYLLLAPSLHSQGYSINYKGVVQANGQPAYDVEIMRDLHGTPDPTGELSCKFTIDFFIDSSTFHIVMMQETNVGGRKRQILYSDYRSVGGILMPFMVQEQLGETPTWAAHIDQFRTNVDLQESEFSFQ